jgi:3-oxoacyl-[acyl-carrier-protein] synthase II
MRKVVITGMGAVTPIGPSAAEAWASVKAGRHGVAPISAFDAERFDVKLACEVSGWDPSEQIGRKEARRMDRYAQFAMAAAIEAVEDAGLGDAGYEAERIGVIVSSGLGGILSVEAEHAKLLSRGPGAVSPFIIPMMISNMAAGQIAIRFGAKGPCHAITTACASGAHAVGEAYRLVASGAQDAVIAGGAEAAISPLSVAGFIALQALSKSLDPDRASIPFDRDRSGFVMGEGGAILVLEDLEAAKRRGATVYAEIAGYGTTCDAYHITSPAQDGEGAARAMRLAMAEGGVGPDSVSYVNAHGTSTPLNDKFETLAVKAALGDRAARVPVSSTKSMTGHMLGAAGAIEAIFCAYALSEGFVPPTVGWREPDPECDLDCVPGEGRKARLDYALSNSLGLGGHNASLLFKRHEL